MKELIEDELNDILNRLEILLKQAEPYKNEQWLLLIEDKLNALSILF